MIRGTATFTLDYGRCPPWLFDRMVRLSREIVRILIEEYGPDEIVKRMADPVWFQSLGTVLAFDWNASGLTTVLIGALKEAIRGEERNWGLFICGGKGKVSRKTPDQIMDWSEQINLDPIQADKLVYNSRMAAKVDSSLIQDGYQLYHHSFFFSKRGAWAVVQQGMNTVMRTARRYHWYDHLVHKKNFVNEPHSGIVAEIKEQRALNLTATKSEKTRQTSIFLVNSGYKQIKDDLSVLRRHSSELSQMVSIRKGNDVQTFLNLGNKEFRHHEVETESLLRSKYVERILQKIISEKPQDYETLVSISKVGAKTLKTLALVAEVIYGAVPSYEDPARYSFAHGGKDEIPYPVDRGQYDITIDMLRKAVNKSNISFSEKKSALNQLDTSHKILT